MWTELIRSSEKATVVRESISSRGAFQSEETSLARVTICSGFASGSTCAIPIARSAAITWGRVMPTAT